MKKPAPPADTLATMVDRQIGVLVASANAEESPTDGTRAGDGSLSPVEAAILSLDRDVRSVLHHIRDVRIRIEQMETFAVALKADMARVRKALVTKEGIDP